MWKTDVQFWSSFNFILTTRKHFPFVTPWGQSCSTWGFLQEESPSLLVMVATDMWLSGSLCGRENRVLALFDFKLLCRIRWWEFVPWSVLLKDEHQTALVPTGADLRLESCGYLEARSLLWFVGEGVWICCVFVCVVWLCVSWDLKGDRSVWRGVQQSIRFYL